MKRCVCPQGAEHNGSDLHGNQGHGVNARWITNCQDDRCHGTMHREGLQAGRHRRLHRRVRGAECLASQPETRQNHFHLSTQTKLRILHSTFANCAGTSEL